MISALAWSGHGEAAEHLARGNPMGLLDRLMRDMGEHSIRAAEHHACHGREDDRNLRDLQHQPCRRLPQRLAAPETGMRYDVPPEMPPNAIRHHGPKKAPDSARSKRRRIGDKPRKADTKKPPRAMLRRFGMWVWLRGQDLNL